MTATLPVFPVPQPGLYDVASLEAAGLVAFHRNNRTTFMRLVCVFYANFLRRFGSKARGPEAYELLCAEIEAFMTTPDPPAPYQIVRSGPPSQNGLARALLRHFTQEKVFDWKDYYAAPADQGPTAPQRLVANLVKYILYEGFRDGAAERARNLGFVAADERHLADINRGDVELTGA